MNETEFAALYDAEVRSVRAVLFRVCGRPAPLDDLTQEVFLRAWRARSGLREHTSARAWICRIARHVAIDALRSGRSAAGLASVAEARRTEPREPVAPGLDPAERALTLDAFARLDANDRILVVLLCVEEWTMVEVSEVLSIPVGTVKSRAFALRQFLRKHLVSEVGAAS